MKSFIFGSDNNSAPSTSATNYYMVHQSTVGTIDATEGNRSTVVPHAMTLDRLRVVLGTAPGAGKSRSFTVMKNGSTTGLTTTISDTDTANADTTHTVSFSAGDTISLQTVPSGTPTAPGDVAWSIRQDATDLFGVIGGMQDNLTNNAVSYQGLTAQIFSSATESAVYGPVASAGVFKNLYVSLSGSPGSGKSYAFALMVNGSPSALTTTISDAATSNSDTSNTVSVSAGDIVSMRITPSGTPTAVRPRWAMSFDPTTDGESFIIWGEPGGASTSAVRYDQPQGRGANAWSSSETSQWIRIQQATITGLFFKMNGVSGASKTWNLTVRKELASTAATVDITGATDTAASITGLSIAASDDDRIGYMLTPTNTPNNNSHKGGIQLYVAPDSTDLSVSVSDSVTVTESVGRMLESYVSTSDSVTLTESIGRLLESNINTSDSITITENLKELLESNINKSDTITITENVADFVYELFVNVNDSITITESPSVNLPVAGALNIATSDNIAVSENAQLALTPLYVNVSDSITITENTDRMLESYVNKSDTITVTESASVSLQATTTPNINVSDSVTVTESVNILIPTLVVNVSDSITVTENVVVSPPGLGSNIQYPNIFTMEIADPIGKVIVGQGLTAYSNGTPVGAPSGYAMCFDYANNKLYVYNYDSSTWVAIN